MLFERNTPAGAGNELFLATFATLPDLVSANVSSSGFTQIDINDDFNVTGFTNDASGFHLLFERNTPASAGNELFLASFLTLDDLVNANTSSGSFTQIDINSDFDVAGFTNDASGYHLLFERNMPAGAGNELFLASFLTLADLVNANTSSGSFTQIDINSAFDVAGFTNDASGYHLLFERNTPAGAGNELFLASFLTLADLVNANTASGSFTQIDINSDFDVAGFTAVRDGGVTVPVPEPSTLLLVALGLLVASIGRRTGSNRSRNASCPAVFSSPGIVNGGS